MGGSRYCWALAATVLPMVAPMPVSEQLAGDNPASDLGSNHSPTSKRLDLPVKKTPRRARARTTQPQEVASANDWNPSYFRGKEYFIQGRYDEALTELVENVAECREIDFDARKRQNTYFDHVWTSMTQMGQSPHDFIRASNLQWTRELGPAHPDSIEVGNHARRRHDPAHSSGATTHVRARFLAMPTLLTLGWQVLYVGKDWRGLEKSIRLRDAKANRAVQRASTPSQADHGADTPVEPTSNGAAPP